MANKVSPKRTQPGKPVDRRPEIRRAAARAGIQTRPTDATPLTSAERLEMIAMELESISTRLGDARDNVIDAKMQYERTESRAYALGAIVDLRRCQLALAMQVDALREIGGAS